MFVHSHGPLNRICPFLFLGAYGVVLKCRHKVRQRFSFRSVVTLVKSLSCKCRQTVFMSTYKQDKALCSFSGVQSVKLQSMALAFLCTCIITVCSWLCVFSERVCCMTWALTTLYKSISIYAINVLCIHESKAFCDSYVTAWTSLHFW